MGRRLYVGNLPYSATEDQLSSLFSQAGKVDSVRVMRDMATGRARGFAFVEMGSDDDAQKAISQFHEYNMDGRPLVVNEARPKPKGDSAAVAESAATRRGPQLRQRRFLWRQTQRAALVTTRRRSSRREAE